MGIKRQHQRYLVKLPAEIHFRDYMIQGITVRVSQKGFFVRSQRNFPVGTSVAINLRLLDDSVCRLHGIVKYVRNVNLIERKNGMGIELIQGDRRFSEFMKSLQN